MTTMTTSATLTEAYNMKAHGATRIRVRAKRVGKTNLRPNHIEADLTDMSSNTEEPHEKEREFRSRRAHRKSRMGCMRCKQARRKCDEAQPSCSRCVARDADCQYPERPSTSPQVDQFLDLPDDLNDEFWGQFHAFSLPSPPVPAKNQGTALSSTASSVPSPFPLTPTFTSADFDLSRSGQALDARESDLLSHYLSHTARAFAYDTDDLYALQIGFPSLAFRSGLIMKSMLALAAVCKCHDVMRKCISKGQRSEKPCADESDVQEMRDLLALADRYHTESLSQTQAEITGASYYEFALANAPLMVLYGLASQSIRIQITGHHNALGGEGEAPPDEFTPAHSQWISLIRAAHEAHAGMSMRSEFEASPQVADFPMGSKMMSSPPLGHGSTPDASLIAYDGRSSRNSKQLLLPIVSATCYGALDTIRNKAMVMNLSASSQTSFLSHDTAVSEQEQIRACASALDLLVDIASKVCGHGPSFAASPMQSTPESQARQNTALPSWLQDYLARVTNAAPSQASHRTITSFVNRVPTTYLSIVQDVLALIPVEAGSMESIPMGESLTPVQQLAMDIMAHWLVFVMLLDDIWWIGEIGGWELRRVAAVMKSVGWIDQGGGQWWPESMYRIREEVEKHR